MSSAPKNHHASTMESGGTLCGRHERVVAEPEADGIVEGLRDDVQEGAILQAERGHIVDDAAQKQQEASAVW